MDTVTFEVAWGRMSLLLDAIKHTLVMNYTHHNEDERLSGDEVDVLVDLRDSILDELSYGD
jgi:hypothetical protein